MNVLFDMETGDPDDLITLLMLLNNSEVNLVGVTCYQGSPIQIGLIQEVLQRANLDIPIGGWNSIEPKELSPYYTKVMGTWKAQEAIYTPIEVFEKVFQNYSDNIHVLTGAPLTNIKEVIEKLPHITIPHMTTQGGYIGSLVAMEKQLAKFRGRPSFRTYNLGNDIEAFNIVNNSSQIKDLTYVTKDLCHGFVYNKKIHQEIQFASHPIGQLLQKCLEQYALANKEKAMHDPLAMLFMIYPELGKSMLVEMEYRIDERNHPVFSSVIGLRHTKALYNYDEEQMWNKFKSICENNQFNHQNKIKP